MKSKEVSTKTTTAKYKKKKYDASHWWLTLMALPGLLTIFNLLVWGLEKNAGTEKFADVSFDDAADVSEYAAKAVAYFTKAGIINGMGDNKFMPKANATRAQAAKLVYESMIKYGEE